jgi:DNA replication protein DnaC
MLNQPTMEKLQAMKLYGMAQAFREQYEIADSSQLSFEERFGLLVDCQWTWKENRALTRRLQMAKFKERGVIEDIDYQHPRGLDRRLLRTLASSDWVRQHQNLLLIGPTGKSWLACALAHKACRDGFFAIHKRMAELFRDLAVARADGSIGSVLAKLARTDVLVLDDFAMAPMKDSERRDFLEICDDRYQRRSTGCLWRIGMNRSAIPALPTASWTAWCTTRTAWTSTENRSARSAAVNRPRRTASDRHGSTPTPTPTMLAAETTSACDGDRPPVGRPCGSVESANIKTKTSYERKNKNKTPPPEARSSLPLVGPATARSPPPAQALLDSSRSISQHITVQRNDASILIDIRSE